MKLFDAASPSGGFPALDGMRDSGLLDEAVDEVMRLLDPARLGPESLIEWLGGLDQKELEILCARSVERASHFKWFLGDSANGYIVWLHEYKAAALPDAVGSFAASVHNHRYSFVSQVLTGSLLVSDFSVDDLRQFPNLFETRTIQARTTYFLSSDKIHRIDGTAPSTCTLVVQGPPEKPCSRVFDLANGDFRDMYDLPSRFPELISTLSASSGN
jgi:hypothetical protein